ncbi:hypothetical protein P280DRAFT_305241 [Massarina eburnea CBS 473.64]|uniref:RING-type domain-containing protein n=1 Tax=Massarina eburnea CBS 473.64 TaxID=1395130 RepID=A0A6A6S1I9_9PLEO|nr:hypothetical protein P280DRAFT_305241 [Massarina eburnea CBS 473.64]
MSTPEPRISVKKKQAIKYGRKVARLHIGPSREIFTVHEDLICSKSSFFRRKLQPKRQDISGDCSICQEEMRVEGQDLTFCSTSCGGNFHYGCIEKWEERQGRVESGPNCPLCRKAWPAPTMSIVVYRIPKLNETAFQTYFDWLYKGTIGIEDTEAANHEQLRWTAETATCNLVYAYLLGLRASLSACMPLLLIRPGFWIMDGKCTRRNSCGIFSLLSSGNSRGIMSGV